MFACSAISLCVRANRLSDKSYYVNGLDSGEFKERVPTDLALQDGC